MKAGSLLLLPGQRPVCRVGRAIQPPLCEETVSAEETRILAEPMLTDAMAEALQTNGSVERPFLIGTVSGQVNIFLGQGNHHLVFYLDPPV